MAAVEFDFGPGAVGASWGEHGEAGVWLVARRGWSGRVQCALRSAGDGAARFQVADRGAVAPVDSAVRADADVARQSRRAGGAGAQRADGDSVFPVVRAVGVGLLLVLCLGQPRFDQGALVQGVEEIPHLGIGLAARARRNGWQKRPATGVDELEIRCGIGDSGTAARSGSGSDGRRSRSTNAATGASERSATLPLTSDVANSSRQRNTHAVTNPSGIPPWSSSMPSGALTSPREGFVHRLVRVTIVLGPANEVAYHDPSLRS